MRLALYRTGEGLEDLAPGLLTDRAVVDISSVGRIGYGSAAAGLGEVHEMLGLKGGTARNSD